MKPGFIPTSTTILHNVMHNESWYAIHTHAKQTHIIIDLIKSLSESELKFIFFKKEMVHKKGDRYEKIVLPLFPGYIFITQHAVPVINHIKINFPHLYIKLVTFGNKPERVNPLEMEFLLNSANKEGVIHLSMMHYKENEVVITAGPLMNMKGKILFINAKKRKAKVQVELFNKTLEISLGLDIVEQSHRIKPRVAAHQTDGTYRLNLIS